METNTLNLKQLYENEYDRWLTEMVKLLKNRDLENLDYDNLIEELEALGRSERNEDKLTTNLRNYLADELPKIYQNALLIVQKKLNLLLCPNNVLILLNNYLINIGFLIVNLHNPDLIPLNPP